MKYQTVWIQSHSDILVEIEKSVSGPFCAWHNTSSSHRYQLQWISSKNDLIVSPMLLGQNTIQNLTPNNQWPRQSYLWKIRFFYLGYES